MKTTALAILALAAALAVTAEDFPPADPSVNPWYAAAVSEAEAAAARAAAPLKVGTLTPADSTGTNFLVDFAFPVIRCRQTNDIYLSASTNRAFFRRTLLRIDCTGTNTVSWTGQWNAHTFVGPSNSAPVLLLLTSWGWTETNTIATLLSP